MFIGNVEIKNRVVLAPMAGICNSAFRRIIKDMGVGLIYAEMVSDKAIFYNSKKTLDMLYMTEYERPISQQIFGSDVVSFVDAAKKVYEYMKPDIIDINMGCPVPKIALKSQAGAYLLKNPEKIKEIVSSVVNAVPCPVTVKIRSGWDIESINAPYVAKLCEDAGASAICIHGRTRSQGYSGKVDLDVIKSVVQSVNIPVIGNGDISSYQDALNMINYTGCSMVMIGRGVIGNPFLIKEIVCGFDNILYNPPSNFDKINMCIIHLNNLISDIGEKRAILEIRPHISNYLKGIKGSKEIKNLLFSTYDVNCFKKILSDLKDSCI